MARTYSVKLTGPQLRVLHETLSVVLNDPDWPMPQRDLTTLGHAHNTLLDALRGSPEGARDA